MPNWQPNWNDVVYDYAGADQAIAECRATRRVLEDRSLVMAGPLGNAREQWQGQKRQHFDERETELGHATERLIHDLELAESQIQRDAESARNEQRSREAARQRWHAEAAAEAAAAREAERARETARAAKEKADAAKK